MNLEELKGKKIGVLMGGLSGEREVSLRTGAAVLQSLLRQGFCASGIDAGRDLAGKLLQEGIECAFIALHGRYGEDGAVQGLLELMGIPYTGSGVRASSVAMDKLTTKELLLFHELPTPGYSVFRKGQEMEALIGSRRHYPLVVKPAREGSTIGISIVRGPEELETGLTEALKHDDLILIEEFIEGIELTVGVLDGEALPVIQVVPKGGFYDYHAKYTQGQTSYLVPAPIEALMYRKVQDIAAKACFHLGCRGAARVDFMVRERECFCLEVNSIPGMTPTSLLPKAAAEAGMDFDALCLRILAGAGLNK